MTNISHLAGEFLVAGELARRGYPVSITMGNAKSVDIYADTNDGVIKVEAKAGRTKSNWPIRKTNIDRDIYYIFVYLQTDKEVKRNKAPEYFVVTGIEIESGDLIYTWKTRQGIPYSILNNDSFKERWDKIPEP